MKKPSGLGLTAWRARLALPIGTLLLIGGLLASAGPVAAVSPSECAIAGNLVANCGFETGDFTSWTQTGNTGFTLVRSDAPWVHSGGFGARVGPVGSNGSLSQTVATLPGLTYEIGFWLLNPSSSGPNHFDATLTDGGAPVTLLDLNDAPATAYTHYTYTFTAETAVTFSFRHDPAYWGLDDVSVVQVAGPIYFHANHGLDNTLPTATTPQQADSGVLKYSDGNVYQPVGFWTHTPRTLVEGDVHLWLGLKNSDDQGTSFDIWVHVVDGNSTSDFYASCVTSVTRNPALAKEVVIPATYVGGAGNDTVVTVSARIGTTDAKVGNAPKCAGHSTAVGLRLYYDSQNRPSGIWE